MKREGLLDQIHKDFPISKNKNIPIHFTCVFEIGKDHDKTTKTMIEIVEIA